MPLVDAEKGLVAIGKLPPGMSISCLSELVLTLQMLGAIRTHHSR